MAKKIKFGAVLGMIIGLFVMVAIGGAFISGIFADVVILSFFPTIVHQIIGWVIVVTSLLSGLLAVFGK